MSKMGWALSGGGAYGAGQIGMMMALEEVGIRPEVVAGTSVGSINGLAYAMYNRPQEGVEFWKELSNKDVKESWFLGILRGFFKGSAYSSDPLRKYLEARVDHERLRRSKTTFKTGAVNISTGESKVVTLTGNSTDIPEAVDWVMRSAAFPLGLTVEESPNGDLWLDWGLREITPIRTVIKSGCEQIWALVTYPDAPMSRYDKGKRMDRLGMRCLDILIDEVQKGDIEGVRAWNEAIAAGSKNCHDKKFIDLHLIQPYKKYPGDSLDFDPKLNAERYEIGYESAKRYLASGYESAKRYLASL